MRSSVIRKSWWIEVLLLAAFVGLTAALAAGAFLDLDTAVKRWADAHRPAAAYRVALVLNFLGQGGPLAGLTLAVAAFVGWRRHSVRPLLPVIAMFLLTASTIMTVKALTYRAPPRNQNGVPHPERLFSDPISESYPSGHQVNAVVWYGLLAVLLGAALAPAWRPALRALRVVPAAVVFIVNPYLTYHWVTDMVAGMLLGLLLDRLVHRVPWDSLPLGRRLAAAGWAGPALTARALTATGGRP